MSSTTASEPRRHRLALSPAGEASVAILVLSLGVIGGALVFQYVVGLVPCELCFAERWAWYAAIPLAALFLVWQPPAVARLLPLLFGALFLGSAGLAFYHVGVEQHVFAGPTACTAGRLAGGSLEEMTRALMATPVVLCDEVQWSLFGISLAGWNLVASVLAIAVAVRAWHRMPAGGTA